MTPCSLSQDQVEREIEEQDAKIASKDQEIEKLKKEIKNLTAKIQGLLQNQKRINDSQYFNKGQHSWKNSNIMMGGKYVDMKQIEAERKRLQEMKKLSEIRVELYQTSIMQEEKSLQKYWFEFVKNEKEIVFKSRKTIMDRPSWKNE